MLSARGPARALRRAGAATGPGQCHRSLRVPTRTRPAAPAGRPGRSPRPVAAGGARTAWPKAR